RSEEHTSELQSLTNLVCRLLLEKKKKSGTACRPWVQSRNTSARTILFFLRPNTCDLRPRLQEGVLFPFLADGGSGAMSWNYDSLIGQGQHAVVQRAHDLLERSSGEIGASNAACEQGVAGDQ